MTFMNFFSGEIHGRQNVGFTETLKVYPILLCPKRLKKLQILRDILNLLNNLNVMQVKKSSLHTIQLAVDGRMINFSLGRCKITWEWAADS